MLQGLCLADLHLQRKTGAYNHFFVQWLPFFWCLSPQWDLILFLGEQGRQECFLILSVDTPGRSGVERWLREQTHILLLFRSFLPTVPTNTSPDTLFQLSSNCVHLGGKKNKVLVNEQERNHSFPSPQRSVSLRQPAGWVLKIRKAMGKATVVSGCWTRHSWGFINN